MYFRRGRVTRQAHVGLPPGTVEEELGRKGFFGRVTHLYRERPPLGWTRIEGDLRPEAIAAAEAKGPGDDAFGAAVPLLCNEDCAVGFSRFTKTSDYWLRDADGDRVLFVHAGRGHLDCELGRLEYRTGDYLVVPRGIAHRLVPADVTSVLCLESRQEVRLPDRGLLGKHALFDPDVVDVPDPELRDEPAPASGEWEVRVRRRGAITRVFYDFDPIATEGWRGDLAVWRLNVADIRPILSERYHLPPSAHATFVTDALVVCTFLPRGLETGDPEALRVPFYHSNIDYDEVIFYHAGEFFSRAGIEPGMLTFHPQGIHHGPQPSAVAAAKDKARTEEIAVMIDTLRPLEMTEAARTLRMPDYWKSWGAKGGSR